MLKLYRNLKPFTVPIVIVLIMVFLQTMANLYLPTLMGDIVNIGIMQGDTDYILQTGGTMLIYVAGSVICAVISSYFASKTAMGLGRILRNKVFSTVESFSLHEFDKFGTATLITRTTNDITQVQMVTVLLLNMMLGAPMTAIGGFILAFSKDHELTLVLAVAIPVLVITITVLASLAMPLFQSIQKKIDRINLVLRENLTGIRVIRAFNRMDSEQKRFEAANGDLTGTFIKVNRMMAFMFPAMMIIMNVTSLAIIWFGAIRIENGMDIGALTAFTQYAMQIMFAFLMFSMMFIMVPRAQAAAQRVAEVLETKPGIVDPKNPVSPPANVRGTVEFRDVTFRYHGAENPALQGISFQALPGEVTAIIGGTGSGKTSLVNLIPRFYDVDGGEVLVDGLDVRKMTQRDLRSRIGFVPQKSVLFTGTIADNIRFGRQDATNEEMDQAAQTAQATEFIEQTELKYDHVIAEGGTNVSGGQKQRLSIARALAMKPEIYIFDDSFSALDFKTDAKLRAALKKQIADSTVFIISQRVSTVMDADRIIVLDDGKVAGIGRHRELIKSCDVYREIASSQLSEEELA